MIWQVDYSNDAEQDLIDIYSYIADVLLMPETAEQQIDRIMNAADLLEQLPFRYRLFDKELWHTSGLRVLPVDNYLVLYLPDETKHIVTIIRIIYGGRDVEKYLPKEV